MAGSNMEKVSLLRHQSYRLLSSLGLIIVEKRREREGRFFCFSFFLPSVRPSLSLVNEPPFTGAENKRSQKELAVRAHFLWKPLASASQKNSGNSMMGPSS
jgi:hypothetical protein